MLTYMAAPIVTEKQRFAALQAATAAAPVAGLQGLLGLGLVWPAGCDQNMSEFLGTCATEGGVPTQPLDPAAGPMLEQPANVSTPWWQSLVTLGANTINTLTKSSSTTQAIAQSQAAANATAAKSPMVPQQWISGVPNEYLIYGALGLVAVLVVAKS